MASTTAESIGQQARERASTIRRALSGSHQNISESERWCSVGAGAVLFVAGLARGKFSGTVLSVLGGALLHRGITGHCYMFDSLGIDTAEHKESTAVPAQQGAKFETTVTINRPAEELYRFWRNPENLSRVMRHVKEVRAEGNNRSHWVACGIAGQTVEWDAEIFNERENEMIAWKSLPGGDVDTAGSVHFKSLGDGRGTEVTVSIKYNPPGGKLGAGLASMLGSGVEQKIQEDLQRFKETMENSSAGSGQAWAGQGSHQGGAEGSSEALGSAVSP